MDVINYLEQDHETVLKLLAKLQRTSNSAEASRKKQFAVIKQELYLHEQVEQQILYPALKKKDKADVLEAYEEHNLVNLLLEDIEKISFSDERFVPKIIVLTECLKHHIKEERSILFPLTKKLFDKNVRVEMAREMEAIKNHLKESF